MRKSTKKSTHESERRRADTMNAPKRPHMSATGRAKPPVPGFGTAADNRVKVAALQTGGPSDVMLYYGGPPSPGGHLEGMAMQGPSIARSSWPPSVKHVAQELDQHFSLDASRTPAPHKDGAHYVEDAHYRRQSAGGFTDATGGTPAAVGLNVQDMGYEEGHDMIAKSFKPNQAREVQVGRVAAEGPHAGTLTSKNRMMFMRHDPSQPYVETHNVTQDGHRDMPDKDEIRGIKKEMGELSPSRPAASPSAFSISSTPKPRPVKYNAHTQNDSADSLYFSGMRSPGGTYRTGSEATEWVDDFYQNIRAGDPTPAASASQNFSGTGSYTPPFVVPPSSPVQPSTPFGFQFGAAPAKKK
ncbi:MAG TPA: hypothetical protein VJS66_05140 [Burkholderiales bacterium]|nr:hypothetical protein [Burkholderiales bacterium]